MRVERERKFHTWRFQYISFSLISIWPNRKLEWESGFFHPHRVVLCSPSLFSNKDRYLLEWTIFNAISYDRCQYFFPFLFFFFFRFKCTSFVHSVENSIDGAGTHTHKKELIDPLFHFIILSLWKLTLLRLGSSSHGLLLQHRMKSDVIHNGSVNESNRNMKRRKTLFNKRVKINKLYFIFFALFLDSNKWNWK